MHTLNVHYHCANVMFVFSLHELHLSQNGYSSVDLPVTEIYKQLVTLHINHNNIASWYEVIKLGKVI